MNGILVFLKGSQSQNMRFLFDIYFTSHKTSFNDPRGILVLVKHMYAAKKTKLKLSVNQCRVLILVVFMYVQCTVQHNTYYIHITLEPQLIGYWDWELHAVVVNNSIID